MPSAAGGTEHRAGPAAQEQDRGEGRNGDHIRILGQHEHGKLQRAVLGMPACHKFLLGFGEILTPNRYDMISETNPNPVARMKKIRMGAQFSSMLSVSQNRWSYVDQVRTSAKGSL